jgi:hypothetical protein
MRRRLSFKEFLREISQKYHYKDRQINCNNLFHYLKQNVPFIEADVDVRKVWNSKDRNKFKFFEDLAKHLKKNGLTLNIEAPFISGLCLRNFPLREIAKLMKAEDCFQKNYEYVFFIAGGDFCYSLFLSELSIVPTADDLVKKVAEYNQISYGKVVDGITDPGAYSYFLPLQDYHYLEKVLENLRVETYTDLIPWGNLTFLLTSPHVPQNIRDHALKKLEGYSSDLILDNSWDSDRVLESCRRIYKILHPNSMLIKLFQKYKEFFNPM